MTSNVWDNLPAMLEDIWKHRAKSGHDVFLFDDPKGLRFGFKSETHEWLIQRGVVARYFNTNLPREPFRQNLVSYFKSPEARAKLANLGSFPDAPLS